MHVVSTEEYTYRLVENIYTGDIIQTRNQSSSSINLQSENRFTVSNEKVYILLYYIDGKIMKHIILFGGGREREREG